MNMKLLVTVCRRRFTDKLLVCFNWLCNRDSFDLGSTGSGLFFWEGLGQHMSWCCGTSKSSSPQLAA